MGPADVRYGRHRRARHVAVNAGERTELLYAIRQTVEDASLARSARSARQCALSGEKTLSRHPVYGQSACLLECDVRERRVHANNSTQCDCPPTCSDTDIHTVWNGTQRSNDNITRCILTMSKPATERLVMKAKRDYIDTIVIFSCLLQFFIGINLLDIPKFILNYSKM